LRIGGQDGLACGGIGCPVGEDVEQITDVGHGPPEPDVGPVRSPHTALRRDFDIKRLDSTDELVPSYGQPVRLGYIDAHFRQPWMLTLKDQAIADAALEDHAEPYRRLDTAVLEALILKGALGMTDDDIDHLAGLGYARDFDQALELVQDGDYDAAFFVAATPIEAVREVAAAGESMPPKSTYFFPKVPTGLLFNPLSD